MGISKFVFVLIIQVLPTVLFSYFSQRDGCLWEIEDSCFTNSSHINSSNVPMFLLIPRRAGTFWELQIHVFFSS